MNIQNQMARGVALCVLLLISGPVSADCPEILTRPTVQAQARTIAEQLSKESQLFSPVQSRAAYVYGRFPSALSTWLLSNGEVLRYRPTDARQVRETLSDRAAAVACLPALGTVLKAAEEQAASAERETGAPRASREVEAPIRSGSGAQATVSRCPPNVTTPRAQAEAHKIIENWKQNLENSGYFESARTKQDFSDLMYRVVTERLRSAITVTRQQIIDMQKDPRMQDLARNDPRTRELIERNASEYPAEVNDAAINEVFFNPPTAIACFPDLGPFLQFASEAWESRLQKQQDARAEAKRQTANSGLVGLPDPAFSFLECDAEKAATEFAKYLIKNTMIGAPQEDMINQYAKMRNNMVATDSTTERISSNKLICKVTIGVKQVNAGVIPPHNLRMAYFLTLTDQGKVLWQISPELSEKLPY